MGYLEGFGITIRKWLGPGTDTGRRVTSQYPEQTRPKPERFHGRHVLNRYEDGMEKCIGCELCAGVCPAKCIYVRGADNDPDDPTSPGERFGFIYEINYLRCIHCDLCVEACPTEAITETKLFEFAFTNRADAIYTKAELVVGDDGRPQQLPWENWDGGFDPAQDASGWMRATAPSGDAEFNGIVAWAGELGFGVRAPEGGGRVQPDVADTPAADLPVTADDHADHHDADHDHAADQDGDAEAEGPFAAPELASEDLPLPPLSAAEQLDVQEQSPLLVDADESAESYETDTLPALGDEPAPAPEADAPAPETPRQTAGFFDAPGTAGATPQRSAPLPPLDTSVQDAQVAQQVEEAFADTPSDDAADDAADTAVDEPATDDAGDEQPADDDAGDDPTPPAPPSGPGFFDLPDAPESESESKRRRRGWGRR